MSSNTRFALIVACLVGLAFVYGALLQASYIAKVQAAQAEISSFTVRENTLRGYTQAGVSLADSLAFELAASEATEIDLPTPEKGSPMCAFVRNDTIFVEYWRNGATQRNKFRYVHGN